MDARRQETGDWEEVQPLGKRELDHLLKSRMSRRDRRLMYQILDEAGLCIFEK